MEISKITAQIRREFDDIIKRPHGLQTRNQVGYQDLGVFAIITLL